VLKKVLIVTYYFPPSGGAGVQRMLKLVKYIRQFGWEPIVYTAKDAEYPVIDESLFKDIPDGVTVLRNKIREPYGFYKRFIGQKKNERVYSGFLSEHKTPSLAQRISVWLRGNLFIPDARMWWINPSVKFLTRYLRENPVDAILSSGPPHTTHMIASGVKRKLNIPWLADFRDPWTRIDFYEQLHLTKWADAKHKRLEKSVLTEADKVVTVSWQWAEEFERLGGRKVDVITNGFDEDDYSKQNVKVDTKFSLVHVGSINPDRNPHTLWKVLSALLETMPGFKENLVIRLIGKNDSSIYNSIEQYSLTPYLERVDYMPHSAVGREQQRAAVLLLLLNNTPNISGIIPGKVFEYLAAKRPVLVIGSPKGDSARIVRESNAGDTADFNDFDSLQRIIKNRFEQFQRGDLCVQSTGIDQFSRLKMAEKFANALKELNRNKV
ncbi:MAG TPA: glycosyltransferase, partial [Chitinophagales bacterium]|nr:glycosyltransferase [Chitinophagales bacterium]